MTKIIPMRSRGGLPSTRGKGIATCMKQSLTASSRIKLASRNLQPIHILTG
jgi:hypothetical protein